MRIGFISAIAAAAFVGITGAMWLPPIVASHFDASGTANGFMSRGAYIAVMVVVCGGIPLLLTVVGRRLTSLPDGLINIPNRSHWLAPGRRASSLASLSTRLEWLALAVSVFLCYAHVLVVLANTDSIPRTNTALLIAGLAVFLVFMAVWLLLLFRRFRSTA